MLIAEPQRRQVYHPHTEPISPIRTGIKATQTIPSTDHLSDSSSQTSSAKLKHRGVDPNKTLCTALREFINTKDRATATSTPYTKNSRTQTSQPPKTQTTHARQIQRPTPHHPPKRSTSRHTETAHTPSKYRLEI